MELRHLRYFAALAEELSFTRAAARLRIAQPALSVQIRKLEIEVGAELVSREGRSVTLTEAGKVFLEQARQMLAQASHSVALARRAANGELGNLSIGYATAAEFRVFPRVLPAFLARRPGVHVAFKALKVVEQIEALRRDELDVSLVWLPIPSDEFDVQPLTQEPLMVAVPAEHRLAKSAVVAIRDLSREPLILFARAQDPETYHQIEQLFLNEGATMNVAHELETLLSAINFVAMGAGCALLPDYARGNPKAGVVYKALKPTFSKTLAIAKKKRGSQLAEAFYRFAIDELAPTSKARAKSKDAG
ncbi:LysR substrate-binding domain-containing protein [Terricaulis silvestris]|uniref:Hca operon transcriptional activator n=1 Tax=Terricaulis silvestris TaxID=2686094 RepID=A0A6I6MJT2_9CAUL|nr:LysR substrate-binding domain-containing protein [Terricaulis silvestris]QGZ94929.1 Hca operon transcriptional activator [Terricaulis silvestris]